MTAPYGSVVHALSRAFSAPVGKYTASSIFSNSVRGYGEMSAIERIACDGLVQTIAVAHCRPASVQAFRILWEDDVALVLQAMDSQILSFRKPSRRPPKEFCVGVIQRWSKRKILAVPAWSDRRWGRELKVDHKTVSRARLDLTVQLVTSLAAGIRAMEIELAQRDLIPESTD